MAFFPDFGKGVSFHLKALQFIAKHNLWSYFILPLVITIILATLGIYSLISIGDDWGKIIEEKLTGYLPDGDTWAWIGKVIHMVSGIFGWVMKVLATIFFLKILRYIVLILCSPIMARLSERVDEILSGKTFPFRLNEFLHDMFRGILISLRNMLLETLITVGCFIIGFIPIIGLAVIPFLWIMGWYFLGFNMMDYTYERRRMSISQGTRFTRKHKGIAIGNGMVYSFLLWVPLLGICLAPVLSSVAATLATLEALENENCHKEGTVKK
jgi:CysZ protein